MSLSHDEIREIEAWLFWRRLWQPVFGSLTPVRVTDMIANVQAAMEADYVLPFRVISPPPLSGLP